MTNQQHPLFSAEFTGLEGFIFFTINHPDFTSMTKQDLPHASLAAFIVCAC